MSLSLPVVAIFDAGKTNKKILLFDDQYNLVHERSVRFDEITDDDGDPCENVHALVSWVTTSLNELKSSNSFEVKAVNFSSYGASFVHLDQNGNPLLPLYNYLKPFPTDIKKQFFDSYGGEQRITRETASPLLGHLNSGLLLYRLKYQKQLLTTEGYSLHLPQFLSFLVTNKYYSDITSVGCHTMLWDFQKNDYHKWVTEEGIDKRLAPLFPSDEVLDIEWNGKKIKAGIGLHDSSSALIPYLATFKEPFVLISTGTWAISLNPFNESPLTDSELEQDCLCYMTYQRKPVKSSRLFAGQMHEDGSKLIAAHFNIDPQFFRSIGFNAQVVDELKKDHTGFDPNDLSRYDDQEEAYHGLLLDIVYKQVHSTNLVMSDNVKKIFVDGGFGNNSVYMNLLSNAYPQHHVYAATVPQATAMGAALAIHKHWNDNKVPEGIVRINLKSKS